RRVVADFRRFADDNPHAVVNEHAPPDCRAWVDLDSGQPAPPMREPAGEPAKPPTPERIDHVAMPDEGVQAGVAGEDLERRARRRIALEHDSDVFTESIEHDRFSHFR